MQKNTPQLWDSLWKETSEEEDRYNLIREEKGIRWQRIEKEVLKNFGTFKNLKVIEVGAGGGTNALLFAKKGSKVTILDYSKKALERSKEFFKRNKCKANFLLADALKLSPKLKGKYDLSLSFGLAEHFIGKERTLVIKSHLDLVNDKGMIVISVPNKWCFPYRLHKTLLQLIKKWKYGEEYPFSRLELKKIALRLNLRKIKFIGDSFFKSFRYVNPFLLLTRKNRNYKRLKKERGSFLDSYFSYSLVLIARKN
ncbi:class I SAM-dependent methyltransferase [Nanoarchaeota archaeon]